MFFNNKKNFFFDFSKKPYFPSKNSFDWETKGKLTKNSFDWKTNQTKQEENIKKETCEEESI